MLWHNLFGLGEKPCNDIAKKTCAFGHNFSNRTSPNGRLVEVLPNLILTIAELQESALVSSESSLVSRPDQEDRLSTPPQEESSQGKDRISEAATEITDDEKNAASDPLPNDHPSEAPDSTQKSSDPHSLEASVTAVLTPQVEEEDDSRNESPKSEGVPPREVISTGSQQGRTPQKHTPHKTYIASYHLTSLSSYKSFPGKEMMFPCMD